MSGLCALVTFDGAPVDAHQLTRMAGGAPHRGTVAAATWRSTGAGLVQQHLAAPHPGRTASVAHAAGFTAVVDARLDNRAELEPSLLRSGVAADPATLTDAEVILAAYWCWGESCAARLLGDFAFVVFDDRRRRLFAARDPLGMRPLYYRDEPRRRVLLASEIKQLLAVEDVPCTIDELGIVATLAGPYLPADRTTYAGISQLAPGHALSVDGGGSRVWRYWAPDPGHQVDADEEAVVERYRATFVEAVATRLRSPRPVGMFLSGGMDSGAVAATAGWAREQGLVDPVDLCAYSWAFDQLPDSDERSVSDLIVARYDLDAVAVAGDDSWPLAGYPEHGPDRDDPFCWVYQSLVERTLARCQADGMGVMLNGDRGDELTGDWIYDELGLLSRGRLRDGAADLRAAVADAGPPLAAALRQALVGPALRTRFPGPMRRLDKRRHRPPPGPAWIPHDVGRRVGLADLIAERTSAARNGTAQEQRADRLLNPQGARIAALRNRTRARFGLGFADPFSDRRLVELVVSLPQWQVQRRGSDKLLARRAMVGIMPEPALAGAAKTLPVGLYDRGFRDRAVDVVNDLLTNSLAARHGWLDEAAARRSFDHYRTTGEHVADFWWPLCVEMWLRRWWS